MTVHVRVDVTVTPTVTKRLTVRRTRDWFGRPGWRWHCPPCPEHERPIGGFSHDHTFRDLGGPAQARAMDGARRHLRRYHLDPP